MCGGEKLQVIIGDASEASLSMAIRMRAMGPILFGCIDLEGYECVLNALRAAGVEDRAVYCDVTNRETMSEFARYAQSIAAIGRVVVAINEKAGTAEHIWNANALGMANAVEAFLPFVSAECITVFSTIMAYDYRPSDQEAMVWGNPSVPGFSERALACIRAKSRGEAKDVMPESSLVYIASKRFARYYALMHSLQVGMMDDQELFAVSGHAEQHAPKRAASVAVA